MSIAKKTTLGPVLGGHTVARVWWHMAASRVLGGFGSPGRHQLLSVAAAGVACVAAVVAVVVQEVSGLEVAQGYVGRSLRVRGPQGLARVGVRPGARPLSAHCCALKQLLLTGVPLLP